MILICALQSQELIIFGLRHKYVPQMSRRKINGVEAIKFFVEAGQKARGKTEERSTKNTKKTQSARRT